MSKSNKLKLQFIEARAEGKSYRAIAKELKISVATCQEWQQQFNTEIDQAKSDRLKEIYEAQALTRQARLESLGEHRTKIIEALQEKDYKDIPADKLADMLLKVDKELEGTYSELELPAPQPIEYKGIMVELDKLLQDANANKLSPAQIKARLELIKVYDAEDEKQADPLNFDWRNFSQEDTEPIKEKGQAKHLKGSQHQVGIYEPGEDEELTGVQQLIKALNNGANIWGDEAQEGITPTLEQYAEDELSTFTYDALPQEQKALIPVKIEWLKEQPIQEVIKYSYALLDEHNGFDYFISKYNDALIFLPADDVRTDYFLDKQTTELEEQGINIFEGVEDE